MVARFIRWWPKSARSVCFVIFGAVLSLSCCVRWHDPQQRKLRCPGACLSWVIWLELGKVYYIRERLKPCWHHEARFHMRHQLVASICNRCQSSVEAAFPEDQWAVMGCRGGSCHQGGNGKWTLWRQVYSVIESRAAGRIVSKGSVLSRRYRG